MIRSAISAFILLVASVAVCHSQYASTFAGSNEDWRYSTLTAPFNAGSGPGYPGTVEAAPFLGLLGNPAGSIGWDTTTEPDYYQYFLTPAAWNGDRSSLYGETISWDYRYSAPGTWENAWADIAIRDTLNNRWIVADVTTAAPTEETWNTFSVKLNTTGMWRIGSTVGALATNEQILAALQNMGGVFVRGEAQTGTVEKYQMDNFRWPDSVPEAGTMASFGALLSMGFIWLRRRVTT